MRDRFVGDVGDFGKYGLLRALCGQDSSANSLRLGIVWHFVPDRMIEYLNDPGRFEACDPELFGTLKRIVEGCQRRMVSIEASHLFPKGTVFFREEVPPLEKRAAWRERAIEKTKDCDLVFFDPDNGLRDDASSSRASPKYVYYEDLEPFLDHGKSLVVYHHLGRTKHDVDIASRASKLRGRLGRRSALWALRWRSYAPRAYFIIPNGREAVLRPRVETMRKDPWGQHFERVL